MGTIEDMEAVEVTVPAPSRRPYGLFSHVHWLGAAEVIGENRSTVEGEADDPPLELDATGPLSKSMGLGQWARWEGPAGVAIRPLPLVADPPLSDVDDEDSDPAFDATAVETRDLGGDWTDEKVTFRAPGYREFDTGFMVMCRQEVSAGEPDPEAAALAAYDLMIESIVEAYVYDQLRTSDRIMDVTGTVGTIPNSFARLDAAWTDAGLPTFLLPHFAWPFLDTERYQREGSGAGGGRALFTASGSPLVLAKGFDDVKLRNGDDPDPGQFVIYATGELFGFRTTPAVIDQSDVAGNRNDRVLTIEQSFLVGWNSYRELSIVASSEQVV